MRLSRTARRSLTTTIVEVVLAATRCRQAVVVPKAAAVITIEETQAIEAIEAVAPSDATRTIATIGGDVISIPTADVTTQRPRNVSTRTTDMALMYGTMPFTNRPGTADSPTHSPLGLVVVKAVEEVDVALVAAEAVDEAVEDSKVVVAFRVVADSKAVGAATIMTCNNSGHGQGYYYLRKSRLVLWRLLARILLSGRRGR